MKRIVASIGVAALGAACIPNSNAQGVSGGDGAKPWTASVALRGFYDDNLNTTGSGKVATFGGEISPTLAFSLPMDQTTASLIYTYSAKYYDKKPAGNADHIDQTHTLAAQLIHQFDERTTASLADSFVIGQEPDVLRSGNTIDTLQRISGSNIRNYGSITINHQFSPKFGVEAGYANSLFDYEDNFLSPGGGHGVLYGLGGTPFGLYPVGVNVSRSGVLDRIEHNAHVDARWTMQPSTVALVGYAFGLANYTANEPIGVINSVDPANTFYNQLIGSSARDVQSHYGYVGIEHTFRPDLFGSLRVGARFSDYFNAPTKTSDIGPYAAASVRYSYAKDSNLQVGFSYDLSATDAFSTLGASITTSSDAAVAYASITHRILPELFGTLMGQFQNSTFNGGQFDGISEQFYLMSASLEYRFNRHVSTTVSYHYDKLESALNRGFDRNRVFLGATVTY
jgi:hypothetical protein